MIVFIRTLALAQPLMAMDFTLGGALRGAGDTRFPLWSVILGFYGARLGWATVAAFVLEWNVNWIWFALFGDYVVRAVMKGGRFRSGKWQKIRV
jgi:Na+-driven multidrug efflux pump